MSDIKNRPKISENFTMDGGTSIRQGRGVFITKTTLFVTFSIFVCLLIGTGILMYNFPSCSMTNERPNLLLSSHRNNDGHNLNSHSLKIDENVTISIINTNEIDDRVETTPVTDTINAESVPELDKDVRLPVSIKPISYDLQLIPYLFENNFTFNGKVRILVTVEEECDNITLHAVGLKISDTKVYKKNDIKSHVAIEKLYFVETKQFYVIKINEMLAENEQYIIEIKYDGVMSDYLQGFYKSSYTVGSETRWLGATQFQPTDARRAFPCFDEPAFKANFSISIARPKDKVTLSNMPKMRTENLEHEILKDYVLDIYQQSVPMSTYLLAFVICDFVNVSSGNFAVWARADAISSAKYSLDIGPKILKYLEDFFNIKYPLPKVDMIALPDFSAGAMENWGLITYRETAMLYEEGVSAISIKQRVATVVCHELAHQWFGNLVTPLWWSDLWLNEGFASYMEYVGVEGIHSDWKSMDQFVVNELQNVFSLDALSSSHPISIEVQNPEEINEIFDRISYAKGATIIRMMDHFLTTRVFKNGLTNYLNDKKYDTAEQDDLWEFLTREARKHNILDNSTSVKTIMDTWTLQTGFPYLQIERNYENTEIKIKQERFRLIEGKEKVSDGSKNLWWIPLTYTTEMEANFNSTKPRQWMSDKDESLEVPIEAKSHEWIIFNIQQTGYFRVNYDVTNWMLITNYLQNVETFKKIAPSNRAQLIDDSLNLARAGYLDYTIALNVTKYLKHETDYVPWKAAIAGLNFIDAMLIKTVDYDKFRSYSLKLMIQLYDEVGFEDYRGSPMLTVYKRIDVLNAMCHLGYKNCTDSSIKKFYEWIHEANPDINNPISPNLKNIVYCTAIRYGSEKEWEFAWDRFQRTTISSEKELLLSALGCSREPWILMRYLERSMTSGYGIRKQDVFRVFIAVSNNVIGQRITFNYIKNNWKKMKEYLGSSMSNLNSILKYTTKRISDRQELEELKTFAESHLKEGRTILQIIERAESNISWLDRNYDTIVSWLKEVSI